MNTGLAQTRLAAALLLGLLAAPWSHAGDTRIRSVDYAADAVVRVPGREGFQSAILFGDDEKIENVAVGDSFGWQVTPNKRANLLFLKPMPQARATNMTVVTDRRVYLFDLQPAPKSQPALYSLRFLRHEPPPAEPAPDAAAAPPAPEAAPAPPPPPAEPAAALRADELRTRLAELNFAWRQEGASSLWPAQVFDDGHSIYLGWKADVPLPAILGIGPDGVEGPVNYAMRGQTLVVDGPLDKLVLRAGKARAVLTREAAR